MNFQFQNYMCMSEFNSSKMLLIKNEIFFKEHGH